ncbi:MAG: SAM-dependent methyltransferase [Candidatus Brocadia sp.]|nr:SAM-dependent methyltransferase [Candidatus Brocadia sp.]
MGFTLDKVVPWGRSFEEYVKMFGMTDEDLKLRILGCSDGPASFNSGMNKRGYIAISIDPIYQFDAKQIEKRIQETYDDIIEQLHENKGDYIWNTIKSVGELGQVRMSAMREFLADYEKGKQERRYLAESLPSLPFGDGQFDLALCSHFLFLYTKQLSFEFHRTAIAEMIRVAKEVRIFPLLDLEGLPSPYVDEITEGLQRGGYAVEVQKVPYEFQRGGNQMIRIRASNFVQ